MAKQDLHLQTVKFEVNVEQCLICINVIKLSSGIKSSLTIYILLVRWLVL